MMDSDENVGLVADGKPLFAQYVTFAIILSPANLAGYCLSATNHAHALT